MRSVKPYGKMHSGLLKGSVSLIIVAAVLALSALPVGAEWHTYLKDYRRTNHLKTGQILSPDDTWQEQTTGFFYRHRRRSTPSVAPPVIDRGVIFEGTPQGRFMAFDASTGRRLWVFKAPYGIDAPATATERLVCLATVGGTVHCLDRKDGRQLWSFQATSDILAAPVIDGERLFVNTLSGRVYALSLYDGRMLWSYSHHSPHYVLPRMQTSPALDGQRLFVFFPEGLMVALDKTTGRELWTRQLYRVEDSLGISPARRTPTVVDGTLYIVDRKGRLLLLDAADGREIERYPIANVVDFAIAGDRLYIATTDRVVAVARTTSERLWTLPAGEHKRVYSILSCGDRVAVISNIEEEYGLIRKKSREVGTIDIVDAESGRLVWSHRLPHRVATHGAADGTSLAIVTVEGRLVVAGHRKD